MLTAIYIINVSANAFCALITLLVDLEVNLVYYERCYYLANNIPQEEN